MYAVEIRQEIKSILKRVWSNALYSSVHTKANVSNIRYNAGLLIVRSPSLWIFTDMYVDVNFQFVSEVVHSLSIDIFTYRYAFFSGDRNPL